MKTLNLITSPSLRRSHRLDSGMSFYSNNKDIFFLTAFPKNGGISVGDCPETCRELFSFEIMKSFENGEMPKKAHIAVFARSKVLSRNHYEVGFLSALRCINLLEIAAGWRTLSKIVCLRNDTLVSKDTAFFYLFIGSEKWFRSPHMASLYCFLIRAFFNRPSRYSKVATAKELIAKAKKDGKHDREDTDIDDNYRLKDELSSYFKLMQNFDKVFKDLPRNRNFSRKIIGDPIDAMYDGVGSLLGERSRDKALTERIRKYIA